jgi:hypothetical protein
MEKKPAPDDERKDTPSRAEHARQVAEEYANDLREVIRKLRQYLN